MSRSWDPPGTTGCTGAVLSAYIVVVVHVVVVRDRLATLVIPRDKTTTTTELGVASRYIYFSFIP